MRLAHRLETMALDQSGDPAKTRPHVGRESLDLISYAGAEQFNDPRHSSALLHFCNTNTEEESSVDRLSQPRSELL